MHVVVCTCHLVCSFFLFKQKTAYEWRISDWSSDVCSSDLLDIGKSGRASWILRVQMSGKRRDLGLGSLRDVSLREAREKASEQQIGRASCRERVCQYV